MRQVLLSLVLCTSVLSAEVRLGPERPISPPEPAHGAIYRGLPRIATDGKDFLVLWLDGRSGSINILGTRVTADGRILDPTGIAVTRSRQASIIDLHWNGTEYVLTAGEYIPFQFQPTRHYFAIGRDGSVRTTGEPPAPAHSWPVNERGETVHFTGFGKGQHTLWFVDPNGLEAKGVDLPEHYAAATHVIPMPNREFAVVFGSGRLAQWALFNRTQGLVRSRALFNDAAGTDDVVATIAVSGQHVGAGWVGFDFPNEEGALTKRSAGWVTVNAQGTFRSGRFANGEAMSWPIAILGDGATFHYAATFTSGDQSALQTFRIFDGHAEGPFIVDPAEGHIPSMATSGTRNILTWIDGCLGGPDCRVAVTTFARGGTPLENEAVSASEMLLRQTELAAAAGDGSMLTVWRDLANPSSLRGRLTTANASPMIDISPGGTVPRVAFAGGSYGVIWYEMDDEQLLLRRFDNAGNAIDAAPVVLSRREDARNYHIVPRGDVLQVAWLGPAAAIRTVAVPATGKVPPSILVTGGTVDPKRQHMILTSHGNVATMVWTESTKVRNEPMVMWRSIRLTGANALGPIVEMTRTSEDPAIGADAFAAALSDHALLVVLSTTKKDGGCLWTHTFAPDGATTLRFREPLACSETGGLLKSSLMWDGTQWWTIVQGATTFVQAISRDGVPGTIYEVADAATSPVIHSVVRVPAGVAVLYTRIDGEHGGVRRAFVRTIGEQAAPGKGRAVRR